MYSIHVRTDAGWVVSWLWKDRVFYKVSDAENLINSIDEKWRSYYKVQHV